MSVLTAIACFHSKENEYRSVKIFILRYYYI